MQQGLGASAAADRVLSPAATEPSCTVSAHSGDAPLRVLSLFAGIGGFDLGLERTGGFKTVAFCEIEPFAVRVLNKHWPEVPVYGDVRELTAKRLAADGIAIDVICGGFPCQDLSVAGAGVGLDGERSGLWFEYARLIGELRPAYVLVENVAELLDRGMGRVLGSLASLGYDAEWHCIPASYLGAWHRRDRVWLVAYANENSGREGRPAQPILRQRHLSVEPPRVAPRWPGRSNLPTPRLCRNADGVPDRVGRTETCGNAVAPQIPELIGGAILAAIADTHRNGGDSTEIEAPFMSGGGARSAIAQGRSR